MNPPPRFAADVMLGKLAKWLRLLGLDTYYSNRAEDPFLSDLARREKRILLTRDHLLHRQLAGGGSYLVQSDRPRQQLSEIASAFRLQGWRLPPRCSLCNGELDEVAKPDVAGLVPPYVFQTQTDFTRCRLCAKIYWPGTHLPKIRLFLEKAAESPR